MKKLVIQISDKQMIHSDSFLLMIIFTCCYCKKVITKYYSLIITWIQW